MNTMTLDGYVATIAFDEEAALLHGEVINTRDVLTFRAISTEGLRAAFQGMLDDDRAWCAERGKEPAKLYRDAG